tara:strand:+ start:7118 stop:7276 length:159 start_codon:yes stop_codon:yes gene_type:complete
MKIGTLVKTGDYIGIICNTDIDEDNGEPLYQVIYNDNSMDWYYTWDLEVLCK